MSKRVLILCTGNSCRSIIAEALVNRYLNRFDIEAFSGGVSASGEVNPNAKRVLEENKCWSEEYHSKNIDEFIDEDFDLLVTVCDNAKESCPTFSKAIKTIHIGFEDPDGKEYSAFIETFENIKKTLLPKVERELFGDKIVCYCKKVFKRPIIEAIKNGATSLEEIRDKTTACSGKSCRVTNPSGKCCGREIIDLIEEIKRDTPLNSSCGC